MKKKENKLQHLQQQIKLQEFTNAKNYTYIAALPANRGWFQRAVVTRIRGPATRDAGIDSCWTVHLRQFSTDRVKDDEVRLGVKTRH